MKSTTQVYKGIKLVVYKDVGKYSIYAFNADSIKAVDSLSTRLKRDAIQLMKIRIDNNDYNKFTTK